MNRPNLDDVRSTDPVQRLLEDSWSALAPVQPAGADRRGARGRCCSWLRGPAGAPRVRRAPFDGRWPCCSSASTRSRRALIKFPIGAGYVVPSYLVLVPMLLLLPPATVPLLTAAGLVLGTLGQVAANGSAPSACCSRSPTRGTRSARRSCWCSPARPRRRRPGRRLRRRLRSPAACSTCSRSTIRESAALGIASRFRCG